MDMKLDKATQARIDADLTRESTRTAYAYDCKMFDQWRARYKIGYVDFQIIVNYLIGAMKVRAFSTVERYAVSLGKAHNISGNPEIKKLLKGFRVNHSRRPNHTKALEPKVFKKAMLNCKSPMYKCLMFFLYRGAMRIQEVLSLRMEDVEIVGQGFKLTLLKTKTSNEARVKGIAAGSDLKNLFSDYTARKPTYALIFPVKRCAVHSWIKRNIGEKYSSHSFRAGHVTYAFKAGMTIKDVQRTTGHKSTAIMLDYYDRATGLFDNSSGFMDDGFDEDE